MNREISDQVEDDINKRMELPCGLKQIGSSVYVDTRRPLHIVIRDFYLDYIRPALYGNKK